ncbi:hypothetical protein TRFO_37556 [Tritrichomonas foetus]|uniref:Uncharacterized protein n=1 Tax=Tritrichomonas foetus TaxID=1144522 RepID=A0A1J4JF57_9EUKA|nr:hypothetical protein TRFO_37556 [Tritrichomonas foetus]|eukprot:OHS96283.1 hypothetical protein TRFO_37556 [Tritrichomonas foetus]
MSIWKRLQSYVVDFEKSIDADFAQRNQTIIQEQQEKAELSLPQVDNSDNDKPEQEQKPSQPENNAENENVNVNDEAKAEELKAKIHEIEIELENQNKIFEERQKLKEEIGPNVDSLFLEFETRFNKINNQIQELNKIEDKFQAEINEYTKNTNDLQNAQTDYSTIQKELTNAQEIYQRIINDSKLLIDEDQQLTISIDRTNDQIKACKKKINDLKNEKIMIDKKIRDLSTQIDQEKEESLKFSTENSQAENNLQVVKEEQSKFLETVNQYRNKIADLKEKIKNADIENERALIEKRKMKVENMKNLTNSLIEKMENERIQISTQIKQFTNEQIQQEEKDETEIRDMRNMISDAEIEGRTLNQRFLDTKTSVPKLVEPIEMQIDSLKSIFSANESVEKTVLERLSGRLAEIEAKKESVENSTNSMRLELDKLNQEKSLLNMDSSFSTSQELSKSIEAVSNDIESIKSSNYDLSSQMHSIQAEIALTKSKLRQISGRSRNLESQYLSDIRNLEYQLEQFRKQEENASSPSLFAQWKKLAKKCGDMDNELELKHGVIQKKREIEIVFNQTLEIVAERQESLDIVKRTINREKDFFKQRVAELIDQ